MKKKESTIGILTEDKIQGFASQRQFGKHRARIGFIGAGWWATTNHMPILKTRPDVELVVVCGLDQKVLARCQHDFGFQYTTTDYLELLQYDLDAVVVATPHSMHMKHTLAALEAGCHVMVEKPLATRARDARAVVDLANRNKRHLLVPYGWHYRPLGQKAKALMAQIPIGKIEFVLCHMASPIKNLLTGRSFDYGDSSYVNPDLATYANPMVSGGGYGQVQLSHATGLMLWLTGLRAESVFAMMSQPGSQVDLYNAFSVSYKGGAIGTVSGAGTQPIGTQGTFQLDIRIFGENGLLHVDIARDHLSLHTHDGRHETFPLQPGDGAYQCDGPPHQFIELVHGLTTKNESSGELALHSVELLDAAYQSSCSGKVEII